MSKQRPEPISRIIHGWTDEELGVIADTLDRPATEVASRLGRSGQSIYHARRRLRDGRPKTKHQWSDEEDQYIQDKQGRVSAAEIAEGLPGRTEFSVRHRIRALGLRQGYAQARSPFFIAHRPLLAKSCTKCGLILPADWFKFAANEKRWSSWCRRCHGAARTTHKQTEGGAARNRKHARAYQAKAQAITLATATRKNYEYTEADHTVLSDESMTNLGKALKLGRTYNAVCSAVSLKGYSSLRPISSPVFEQWIIDNPNLSNLDRITASLRAEVEAQGIQWDWDDDDLKKSA